MDLNVLKRFLNHSASSEDYKKINQWRSEDPSNSNFLFALEELWSKKDEAKYATFTTTNTLDQTNYLIKLTNANDSIYNIEVSEL